MQSVQATYNDKVVRQFAVMTVVWGIVGMLVGVIIAAQLYWPTLGEGMSLWREKLFANMHRNAAAAADFLSLPANRVVELGSKVEI